MPKFIPKIGASYSDIRLPKLESLTVAFRLNELHGTKSGRRSSVNREVRRVCSVSCLC